MVAVVLASGYCRGLTTRSLMLPGFGVAVVVELVLFLLNVLEWEVLCCPLTPENGRFVFVPFLGRYGEAIWPINRYPGLACFGLKWLMSEFTTWD